MRILKVSLLMLCISFFIIACGGGSSDGNDSATGTITGSVSGTTIIAVNENGDIVASYDTTEADLEIDGTFSFTLTGIPVGDNIRVYLITEGGIFPMYFDSNGDGQPDSNVFSLDSEVTIALGFVQIEEDGSAIPENDPTDTTGVSGEGEDSDIPAAITDPEPSPGSTLSQIITDGLEALRDGWVLKARNYFGAAVDMLDGTETPNDADTARFFYALTRVAAVGFDTFSDGDSSDMNKLGDILDKCGCDPSEEARANLDALELACPDILIDGSPTGAELQYFLTNVFIQELEGAIGDLDAVTENFNKLWTEPFDKEQVESDYGDVLVFRGTAKSTLAFVLVQDVYNLDADIAAEVNNQLNTIEDFLAGNPDFLTLVPSPAANLEAAKVHLDSAADDLTAAIVSIQSEIDDQNDDFVNLVNVAADEIAGAEAGIATAGECLVGECTVNVNGTPDDTSDDTIIDLSPFFAGLDFRSPNLLPPFTGDDPSGLFPDPSIGGIVVQLDLNEDIDPADGIPDTLQ